MNVPYLISQKALEDLDSIWQYTFFQWSEKQADKYYNLLIDKILYLSANIETGRKIDHIRTGYRSYNVESHIIFYTITTNGKIPAKKIFVDVYTDWCGWCKRMDATTFSHSVINKDYGIYRNNMLLS